jgi:hypothetical protein
MGKKSRRKKASKNAAKSICKEFKGKNIKETSAMMDEMDNLSLEEQKKTLRTSLAMMGTDLQVNDADQFGNGDQSIISDVQARDVARGFFAIGGDIDGHARENAISAFGTHCILGDSKFVHNAISECQKKIDQPYSRNEVLKSLLDRRETSSRLSPLLFIVSAGKNVMTIDTNHREVAKLLLKAGANPDAKDALGKTVCHYGAGAYASQMTLDVVDMCIEASKSSDFYGRDVELHGLKKVDMNGCLGVVGGYDPDTQRRAVYLTDAEREVWVKPVNIRLVQSREDTDQNEKPILCDVQDRLGSISLLEVIMQDRVDVAKFLLEKHQTSIYIEDLDGMSASKMSCGPSMRISEVAKMVMNSSVSHGKKNRDAKKQATKLSCAGCDKALDKSEGMTCVGCKTAIFCSSDCQVSNWKKHKPECTRLKNVVEGIKLRQPSDQFAHSAAMSFSTGRSHKKGFYRNPKGVSLGEKFVVKVQGGGMMPIMVYDETRTCNFCIAPGEPGFKEVLHEISQESAWNGRKTFMKASFDESGDCTVYPSTAGVKSKYKW